MGDRAWAESIPVAVNDTYGDPFIFEQIRNTAEKTDRLMTQRAPIAIFTKAPLDSRILPYLRAVAANPMVIAFYSLTGLDEGGYDFAHRRRMIDLLQDVFGDVVILTRPIIAGRNDGPGNLRRLVDTAADGSRMMVLGGVHDARKHKRLDRGVETMLFDMCQAAGVRAFHKSSCLGAYMYGLDCWTHDLGAPQNLDAATSLGYRLASDGQRVMLDTCSTGDLNFLRILTRSTVHANSIISNYNLLTIPSGEQKYECTSSWFAWSKNIDTCLGCNYCIIMQIEYLKKNPVQIGTHPRDMVDVVASANQATDFGAFRRTKLPINATDLHTYADVRVVKDCTRHRYAPYDKPRRGTQ